MKAETVTVKVRVQGTCAMGHRVVRTLKFKVRKGGPGHAVTSVDCPKSGCGRYVTVTGSYSG